MSEKRFIFATNEKWFLFDNETEEYMDMEDCKDKLNELSDENEQLKKQLSKYDKLKISIFNKDKGDWKWNDNNDIILNLRTGNKFYLRNSGAVENLVDLLNEQQASIEKLEEENKTLKKKERSWKKIHCCNKESNNCGIVIEQQATITKLNEENEHLKEKNKEIGLLKRDLYTIIRDTKDTPFGNTITMRTIRERWE